MCDNLDVEGKERCGLEGQSLNTVVGSCEPARDSWTLIYIFNFWVFYNKINFLGN